MFNEDEVIDITNWSFSSEFLQGTRHPKGLQDKHILINPQDNKKYFFKDTWRKRENSYQEEVKHQFWCEYIATKIGESMGLNVPKCFIAISKSGQTDFEVGVLTAWFIEINDIGISDIEVSGKEILSGRVENYIEGYLGESQNNNKFYTLQNIVENTKDIDSNPLEFWFKLLLFDALIGNTDRHDENWGIVIKPSGEKVFTPIYDNGVSLGWREKETTLNTFDFDRFFNGFKYKIRLSEDSNNKTYAKPVDVIDFFAEHNSAFKKLGYDFISNYRQEELDKVLKTIENKLNLQLDEGYRISNTRAKFISEFVQHRYKKLIDLLN